MSESTPILMTLSETCACAAGMASAAATAAPTSVRLNTFIATTLLGELTTAASLHAEIFVQLVHVRVELGVGDHVRHSSVLDHVVPVRHRGGEPEILLDQKDREAFGFQARDGAADLLHDH